MRKLMPLLGGTLLGLGVGIVIFFGFLQDDAVPNMSELSQGAEPLPVPSLDAPAPGFELSSLSGETVQLADYLACAVCFLFLDKPARVDRIDGIIGNVQVLVQRGGL